MPRSPSPLTPVVTAVAVLGALVGARWYVTHRPLPPPPPYVAPPRLDDGDYARRIAPALRSAGCAAAGCHAPGRGGRLGLSPRVPASAAGVVSELAAVRALVVPGDPAASPLYTAAVTAAHHGSTAPGLDPAGCTADQLARWIRGFSVPACAPR